MRSVEDAVERACAHCATARAVLEGQKYNIHRRREGHTRAFDCLPREVLRASPQFAKVDAELVDLILHIHRHSRLLIDHKDHQITVELYTQVCVRGAVFLQLYGASSFATPFTYSAPRAVRPGLSCVSVCLRLGSWLPPWALPGSRGSVMAWRM